LSPRMTLICADTKKVQLSYPRIFALPAAFSSVCFFTIFVDNLFVLSNGKSVSKSFRLLPSCGYVIPSQSSQLFRLFKCRAVSPADLRPPLARSFLIAIFFWGFR
jgi:hypothetical protein